MRDMSDKGIARFQIEGDPLPLLTVMDVSKDGWNGVTAFRGKEENTSITCAVARWDTDGSDAKGPVEAEPFMRFSLLLDPKPPGIETMRRARRAVPMI